MVNQMDIHSNQQFKMSFSVDEEGSIATNATWPESKCSQQMKENIANLLYYINTGFFSSMIMSALMESAIKDKSLETEVTDIASKIAEIKHVDDDVCVKPKDALGRKL